MSSVARVVGRRSAPTAAAVAGGVLVLVVLQQFVMTAASVLIAVGTQSLPLDYLATIWGGSVLAILQSHVPFAVGVFLCLWLVTPIAAKLRLTQVVIRAVLAAGVGAVLALVVTALGQLSGTFAGIGSVFGNSFPDLPYSSITHSLIWGLQSGVYVFVHVAPVVILGAILSWLWLQKHSPQRAVSGTPDEV